MAQTSAKPRFDNIAELLENLGGIPAERVCFDPPPGKATLSSSHDSSATMWRTRASSPAS